MRIYSPYQDYYEVVSPNAYDATYVRSYYGPPYGQPYPGKVLARPASCFDPGPTLLVTKDFLRQNLHEALPIPKLGIALGLEPLPSPGLTHVSRPFSQAAQNPFLSW